VSEGEGIRKRHKNISSQKQGDGWEGGDVKLKKTKKGMHSQAKKKKKKKVGRKLVDSGGMDRETTGEKKGPRRSYRGKDGGSGS